MNERIRKITRRLLSDNWYTLHEYSYEYRNRKGQWCVQKREAYDRGNGAAILLYNRAQRTVILTRQFRLPTYINGNADGMMIEACAGLLDGDSPEQCIIREVEEETGYRISKPEKILEAFMSPGAVTETIHFYIAPYRSADKVTDGGGLEAEQEDIEVLELDFDDALSMIGSGGIQDAKTILLLQYASLNHLID